MQTNHVLIDYENVRTALCENPALHINMCSDPSFKVTLFLGPTDVRLPIHVVLAMHHLGPRAKYITLNTPGPNALDFHIAYYIGELSATEPTAKFTIISKDHGFDPLIKHLKSRGIACQRLQSIHEMACFAKKEEKPTKPPKQPKTKQPAKAAQQPKPSQSPKKENTNQLQ